MPPLIKHRREVAHIPYKERIKKSLHGLSEVGLKYGTLMGTEGWQKEGEEYRFSEIYKSLFRNEPIKHILSLKKKSPKIMILGAGIGEDTKVLKDELNKITIYPVFDVFSLTRTLSPEIKKNIVRNDFSSNVGLEQLDPRIKQHKKIIDATKGKYDLVVAPLSVGEYTNHPATILLNSALLLSKGGKAYIQTSSVFYGEFDYPMKLKKNIDLLFNKLVNTINMKDNSARQFKLTTNPLGHYVIVERLN